MASLTAQYPLTSRDMSYKILPKSVSLPLKVISMGMHAIEIDASSRPHPTQGTDVARHMQEILANEEAEPNISSEPLETTRTSSSTLSSHRHRLKHKSRSPMPDLKPARDKSEQSLSSGPEVNLEDPSRPFGSVDDSKEETSLLDEDLAHAPNRQIQNTGTNAHVFSGTPWKIFQDRVLCLPPEICKIIMDMLFEEAFGPREVRPHHNTSVTNMFLSLDKKLYRRYSEIYWSNNTWIVGNGGANDSMRFMTMPPYNTSTVEFSKQIPNKAGFTIRRIELHFTKEDLPLSAHQRGFSKLGTSAHGAEPQSINSFDLFDDYKSECKIYASELKQLWQDKFDRVAFLELDHFTLDVTQAYAPDGEFLGVDAVQRLLPFVYGMPSDFRVSAPTKVLEREVRKAFDAINNAD